MTQAGTTGSSRRVRAWTPLVGLVVAALGVAAVIGPDPSRGPALDPSSTSPDGAKAVVDTLRALGADVSVQSGAPDVSRTTALVLDDTMSDDDRAATSDWVASGGTLVLADPYSPLSPARMGALRQTGPLTPDLDRGCSTAALREVGRVDTGSVVLLRGPIGSTACFATGDGAWLVIVPQGRGTVVVIGGPDAFTNARLGHADDAVLAAALLAPRPSDRVAVLGPSAPGRGTKTLADLVALRVRLALIQLAVAFVVVLAWRSRRLGRPVVEPQPVELAGSELVVAVGHLLQRARRRDRAAAILRHDLRRTLAMRLGLAADADADQVADAAAAWSGIESARVRAGLVGDTPADEAGLVRLAQTVVSIREEVLGGP